MSTRHRYRAIKGVRTCYRKFAFCTCARFCLLKLFTQSTFNHSGRELVDLAKFGALIQSQAPRLNQYKIKYKLSTTYAQNTKFVQKSITCCAASRLAACCCCCCIKLPNWDPEPSPFIIACIWIKELRNKQDIGNAQKTFLKLPESTYLRRNRVLRRLLLVFLVKVGLWLLQ